MHAPTDDEAPTWRAMVDLRRAHATSTERRAALAWSLAELEDVLATAAAFDPDTGAPVARRASEAIAAVEAALSTSTPRVPNDALWRLAEMAREPLRDVTRDPRTRLQRHHKMERPERARTMDARSMAWLARQPGLDPREKVGARCKVLAVVRETSADVPANRFVRRFAMDLAARLDALRADLADDGDSPRAQRLRTLRLACQCDGEGPLRDVRPATSPTPDNVLLGDRRYARLWRAWLALRALDATTASRWSAAEHWLTAAVAWASLACLFRRGDAVVVERWFTVDPERPGLDAPGVTVLLRSADETHEVVVRAEGSDIELSRTTWRGLGRMRRTVEQTLCVTCRLDETARITPGLGHPCLLEVDGDVIPFEAARASIDAAAQCMIQGLALPAASLRAPFDPEAVVPWRTVGIDLGGVHARLSVDGTRRTGPLLRARCTSRDGRATWVAGDAAARWDPLEEGSAWSAPEMWRAAVEPGLTHDDVAAISALATVARGTLGDGRAGARVAVTVPDGIDEVSQASLRLGDSSGAPWPSRRVWRSVAAVLGWRDEGECPVAPGEAVIVLDLTVPRFGGAALVARCDDGTDRGWRWERPMPLPAKTWSEAFDAGTALAESVAASHADLSPATAETLVTHGISARRGLTQELEIRDRDAWCRAIVDRGDATERLCALAIQWVRELEGSSSFRALRRSASEVRLLVVGAPFDGDEAQAVATALRGARTSVASVEVPRSPAWVVARGAEVFLDRLARGLPTWTDIVPRLCLEVTSRTGRREIEIFPRRAVRAGEAAVHAVPDKLSIPAGERSLRLPLVRDDDGRSTVEMDALIEHPSFPLKRSVEVRLEVQFHHADDGFRVALRPTGAAPFSTLEVQWTRHEGGASQAPSLVDEPPGWPVVVAYEALDESVFERFAESVHALKNRVAPVRRDRLPQRLNAAKQRREAREELVADLGALTNALRDVDSAASKLFTSGRRADLCPKHRLSTVHVAVQMLEELTAKNSLADDKTTEIRAAGTSVWNEAANAMSRLRSFAPPAFVDRTLKSSDGRRWHRLGRALAECADDARRRALAELASAYTSPSGPDREHLWALSTALWGDERFVVAAAPFLDAWWRGVDHVLGQIEHEECGNEAGSLFDECAAVWLGLLRLRGGEHGARVSAHREEVRALGARVARIDRTLPSRRPHRLRVSGSRCLADATACALRGETAARIEHVEEDR